MTIDEDLDAPPWPRRPSEWVALALDALILVGAPAATIYAATHP